MSTIPQLPNEVIEAILLHLPPLSHFNESVRTICNVGLANSRFSAVSRLPRIWQPHYAARWKRSDAAREQSRKSSTHEDWRDMYYARIQIDRKALDLLDVIISQMDNRNSLAVQLANDCGYDVWEAISEETTHVRRHEFSDSEGIDIQSVPIEGLTRHYWAREIIGVISRCRAVNIWLLLTNPMAEDVSFEQGLAALSAFFGADIEKIFEEFDRLALDCQEYLLTRGHTGESEPTETVVEICAWMRQRGFVKADLTNYHHLLNHFPHRVLFEQPVTLPISLVYVFVCVSRRLGINARPVAFPHKVLAMVSPPAGHAIYVDVFESASRPIISYSDLPAMVEAMGLSPDALPEYASPATTATMLLRAVRNIIHSLDRIMWWNENDQISAHYAAYCAALVLTGDVRIIPTLFAGLVGPLDGEIVLRNVLRPGLPETLRGALDLCLTQQEERERCVPKLTGRGQVQYFTGMMFRHVKYQYLGVIKGWDYDCRMTAEWITRTRVSELPRGSKQPFYHSFTPDGRVRYVAEENIGPMRRPSPSDLRFLIEANKDLGRWFGGVEFVESRPARFIMSSESRVLYPDDDMVGSRFLADQGHEEPSESDEDMVWDAVTIIG